MIPQIKAHAEVYICRFVNYTQVLSLNLFLNEGDNIVSLKTFLTFEIFCSSFMLVIIHSLAHLPIRKKYTEPYVEQSMWDFIRAKFHRQGD